MRPAISFLNKFFVSAHFQKEYLNCIKTLLLPGDLKE